MPEIVPQRIEDGGSGYEVWKWGPFSHGDTFKSVPVLRFPDKTVRFTGPGSFGGAVALEGVLANNEEDGYTPCIDSQHTPISGITTPQAPRTLMTDCARVRPSTQTGVAGVTCYLKLSSGGR